MSEGGTRDEPVKRHGLGILDFLEDSFLSRLVKVGNRLLAPVAVVIALSGYLIDLADSRDARDTQAWQLLTTKAAGNSGKIQALEYLNKHNPIAIPNPRRWGIPLGPRAGEDRTDPPKEWILVRDFGPWKVRTPLVGIDLSRPKNEKGEWTSEAPFLWDVRLQNAMLWKANLSGGDLYQADLSGAFLVAADLSRADLERANLSGADLFEATLSGAVLSNADLSYAMLLGAELSGADLTEANLSNASLGEATLEGADLSEANLEGADLGGATLLDAEGLTQDQINQACTSVGTTLPKDLAPSSPPCKRNLIGNLVRDKDGNPIREK